jgi:hypothetical protein
MLAGLSTAQAEDTVLTLTCQGTATLPSMVDTKVLPILTGIVINLTKRTLEGLETVWSIPVEITSVNEATIAFRGANRSEYGEQSIYGTIDRVTGDLEAGVSRLNAASVRTSLLYSLKCRPAQRTF